MLRSLAASVAVLAVSAGMLAPAARALAVEDTGSAASAVTPPLQAAALTTGAPASGGPPRAVGSWPIPQLITYAPAVYSWSQTPDIYPGKVFNLSGSGFAGATISLQRLTGGLWTTVKTTPVLTTGSATLTYTFTAEGTGKFRAILNKAGKRLATSDQQAVSYARQDTYVQAENSYASSPFSTAEGRVAAGTQWSTTYDLYNALSNRRGSLQEYRDGLWRTIQSVDFTQASGWKATVKTPLVNATTSKRYRLTIAATAQEKAWTSGSTVISHMNPADYTGYKKAAYDYMKPYCDKQVITLIGGYTSFAWWPSYRIEMAQTYGTGKSLQYVALHECAHIASFKLYNDDAKLTARMNAIYGSWPAGKEQLADCVAYAMGADKNYGGTYTRDCSGYRGTAARKILAGQKP
ncbi:hypothetical protein C9424_19855 [Arthrobacter sp. H-02-3]|nr:hypothetical protein C9424_19855 [Arthrobacter sp. H-02-3]